MKKKKEMAFCDWTASKPALPIPKDRDKTRIFRHLPEYGWTGIKRERYKNAGNEWEDIVRQTLIGNHGEDTKFHLRYFEISPGGYSSFEKHRHVHVVIGIRGKGICIVGRKKYQIAFLDTVYIKSEEPHQLQNPFDEPFGFFCIVNARRDRPKLLSEKKKGSRGRVMKPGDS